MTSSAGSLPLEPNLESSGFCLTCGNRQPCACENLSDKTPELEQQEGQILNPSASYEQWERAIPEINRMKSFDQQSKYHGLTLGDHSRTFVSLVEQDSYIANHPRKDLIRLAAALHDTGKAVKFQNRSDGGLSFVGHEEESERIINTVLRRNFSLSEEEIQFVRELATASMNSLLESFKTTQEPSGKRLSVYDKFLTKIGAIPDDEDGAQKERQQLEKKFRLVIAFNRGDKGAKFDDHTLLEKRQYLEQKLQADMKLFDEFERAVPAIVEAVLAKRGDLTDQDGKTLPSDQKAGIVRTQEGVFRYNKAV